MERQKDNLNTFWSKIIIEEFIRSGIDYFCISPGSRSTPLTSAAALNKKAIIKMVYDERSNGYYALGYGKFKRMPAVIITTSGTSVPNLYPSIVEAHYSNIPIIVLTADRPPEMQGVNANQAIDQKKIFGNYVKLFSNLPCPDINIMPEFILDTIDHAINECTKSPCGPVHINCQFRKPLEPVNSIIDKDYIKNIKKWQITDKPYAKYISDFKQMPDIHGDQHISGIIDSINSTNKGLISVGTLNPNMETTEIIRLINRLNWPVYADVTSGLRLTKCGSNIIRHFDQGILSSKFNRRVSPEVVLHFGGRITSKRFGHFLEQNRPKEFVAINENGGRNDPFQGFNTSIETDIKLFLKIVLKKVQKCKDGRFKKFYDLKIRKSQDIIENISQEAKEINEVFIARHISKIIPDGNSLFLSSSMPIRDMDLYGIYGKKNILVGSNRGVSGIDGVISTAVGFAKSSHTVTTLLIGDQAFIHDVNSLSLIKANKDPLVIVLVNNQGGGIFHFLPISENKEIFEKYFVFPHDFTFKGVCSSFKIDHFLIQDKKSFEGQYEAALGSGRPVVLEIKTDRNYNLWIRRKIKREILKILEK